MGSEMYESAFKQKREKGRKEQNPGKVRAAHLRVKGHTCVVKGGTCVWSED